MNASKTIRQNGYRWSGVDLKAYKTDGSHFKNISRQTLLGTAAGEEALNAVTRYFEIEPGGYSSLERHHHPHSVVVVRGSGHVILDDRLERIGFLDCVYVAPGCLHQFHADEDQPLGFLCVVDRERDRPILANDEEAARIAGNPEVAALMKR